MHRFSKILIFTAGVVILTLSLAMAGAKFENKDTAANRQDSVFGTRTGADAAATTIETNESGDTVISSTPRPKPEEVDWYDKIIITASPDGVSAQTRTTTEQNASGDVTSTTTVTEENSW